jgi:hypothetical protein
MANQQIVPASLPPFATKLLKLVGRLVASKAHAQVIVTIRDGKVQLISVNQTYVPDNLPE